MRLLRVNQFGVMIVYRRKRERETSVKEYCVCDDRTGRILEEFTRKASAIKWAKANANG